MGRKLYLDKYRVDTIRLPDWDYRSNAQYFITVRTREKGDVLGKIIDNRLTPNIIGIIADKYMREIPIHFPFVKLHECVVMPDHVHMLLEINKRNNVETRDRVSLHDDPLANASRHGATRQKKDNPVEPCHGMAQNNDLQLSVSHHGMAQNNDSQLSVSHHGMAQNYDSRLSEPHHGVALQQIPHPKKGSISIMINQYKGAVKRYCNEHNIKFEWQRRFYDRIIRNDNEFQTTVMYILTNPQNHNAKQKPPS